MEEEFGAAAVESEVAEFVEAQQVEAGVAGDGGRELFVVALDARDGRVSVAGWLERSEASPAELLVAMANRGVRCFLYTPIEVDGTLEGPALTELPAIDAAAASRSPFLISGTWPW